MAQEPDLILGTVILLLEAMDNCGNSRANTCDTSRDRSARCVAFAFGLGHPRRSLRVAALHIRLRPMRVLPSSRSRPFASAFDPRAGLLWAARSALVTLDNSLVDRTGFMPGDGSLEGPPYQLSTVG